MDNFRLPKCTEAGWSASCNWMASVCFALAASVSRLLSTWESAPSLAIKAWLGLLCNCLSRITASLIWGPISARAHDPQHGKTNEIHPATFSFLAMGSNVDLLCFFSWEAKSCSCVSICVGSLSSQWQPKSSPSPDHPTALDLFHSQTPHWGCCRLLSLSSPPIITHHFSAQSTPRHISIKLHIDLSLL